MKIITDEEAIDRSINQYILLIDIRSYVYNIILNNKKTYIKIKKQKTQNDSHHHHHRCDDDDVDAADDDDCDDGDEVEDDDTKTRKK